MNPHEERAKLQFSMCPRWLEYSGVPQALGGTRWAIFHAVIVLDHQTMPIKSRRRGRGGKAFVAPHRDIIATTGRSEAAVKRALGYIQGTKLIEYYKPGQGRQKGMGGRWSQIQVNTGTLVQLYRYVGPRIRPMHGGMAGIERSKLPDRGMRIYGYGAMAVELKWEDLSTIQTWARADQEAEEIDLERIAEICGL